MFQSKSSFLQDSESNAEFSHGPQVNTVALFLPLLFLQSIQDHLGGKS